MPELTSQERFQRIFEHKEADRIPIIDEIWNETLERWQGEGMPGGISPEDYFGLDRISRIYVDTSPRYEEIIIEETDKYIISTSSWGVTFKNWKHRNTTPQFLDHRIKDMDSWLEAKKRMTIDPARIDWKYLETNYPVWKKRGDWIQAYLWFGFDVTHSWVVGTEQVLTALIEDPDWMTDMFNYFLELNLVLMDMIWDKGYRFDSIFWCDDMGYKQNQFFSLTMYRNLLKPVHKKAMDWAHQKKIHTHLHSCGYVAPFIPDLIEIGLEGLNPLEVKAGMDPVLLKKQYGDKLVLHGGINAVLWDQTEEITAEMINVIPVMKENGGYIFSSDHSVPSTVSLDNFKSIIQLAKELGTY